MRLTPILILAALLVCSCGRAPIPKPILTEPTKAAEIKIPTNDELKTIGVGNLMLEHENRPDEAERKYKEQKIKVKGVVVLVRDYGDNGAQPQLASVENPTEKDAQIVCSFRLHRKKEALSLRPGDVVVIIGSHRGFDFGKVHMSDCELVEIVKE